MKRLQSFARQLAQEGREYVVASASSSESTPALLDVP